jgi:hypothetical protein
MVTTQINTLIYRYTSASKSGLGHHDAEAKIDPSTLFVGDYSSAEGTRARG